MEKSGEMLAGIFDYIWFMWYYCHFLFDYVNFYLFPNAIEIIYRLNLNMKHLIN